MYVPERMCTVLDTRKTPYRGGAGYFIHDNGHMIHNNGRCDPQLVMVCSRAVWFLKPGFVKELLRVTVPAE